MSTTKITTIENAIVKAFKLSVEDFYSEKIEIEEDFRACMYFHLRNLLENCTDLQILLSHQIKKKKPDIVIFRKEYYLVAIELKNLNKVGGQYQDFTVQSGLKDVEKIQLLADTFQKGYFIYFTKRERTFSTRNAKWKVGYYREMWHENEKPSIHIKRFEENGPIKFTKRVNREYQESDIF